MGTSESTAEYKEYKSYAKTVLGIMIGIYIFYIVFYIILYTKKYITTTFNKVF